jgi:hypothetical protein
MKLIEETVAEYPATMDYDINIWCDSEWDDMDRTVSLTFYPLYMGEDGNLHTDTSTFYTLRVSLWPRGPKQKAALSYLESLVNSDSVFDANYTDWWSNECILDDAPELIKQFQASLPRKGELHRFVTGE